MAKPNAKEIYTASLILLIGTIYLATQVDTLFSVDSTKIKDDMIQLSKNEILSHVRTILTIVLCFSGGVLLLKIKPMGWVISQSVLLLLLSIALGIFVSNFTGANASMFILIGGIFLLLLAILFLMQKQTRQKLLVTKKSYAASILLFATLFLFYFFLQ